MHPCELPLIRADPVLGERAQERRGRGRRTGLLRFRHPLLSLSGALQGSQLRRRDGLRRLNQAAGFQASSGRGRGRPRD